REEVIAHHVPVVGAAAAPHRSPRAEVGHAEGGHGHAHPVQRGLPPAAVALAVDVELALQADGDAAFTPAQVGAAVVEVDERGLGEVADAKAGGPDAAAPLQVLAVHEELLGEAAGG